MTQESVAPIDLVREAWKTVWSRRYLWWLGVLAGVGQGYGMNPQLVGRFDERFSSWQLTPDKLPPQFAVLALLFVLVLLVLWILSVMAEAGLMRTIVVVGKGEHASFRKGMKSGRPFAWPLIKLNLSLAVVLLVAVLVIGVPAIALIAATGPQVGFVTGGLGMLLFIFYSLLLALLYPWMTRFVVLQEKGIIASIRAAWGVFRHIPRTMIILGIGGVLLQILGSLAIVVVSLILAGPLVFLTLALLKDSGAAGILVGSFVFAVVVIAIVLFGALTAMKNAYYTLAFQKLVRSSE